LQELYFKNLKNSIDYRTALVYDSDMATKTQTADTKPTVKLIEEDGNVFSIMGRCQLGWNSFCAAERLAAYSISITPDGCATGKGRLLLLTGSSDLKLSGVF
jgi:hypothetical protein